MKKLFAYMDVFFRKFQLPKGCEYVGQNAYFGAFQPRRGCISVDKSMCLVALAHIFAAE